MNTNIQNKQKFSKIWKFLVNCDLLQKYVESICVINAKQDDEKSHLKPEAAQISKTPFSVTG